MAGFGPRCSGPLAEMLISGVGKDSRILRLSDSYSKP